ncbi:helix-turn-helix domain-containing protein [Brucella pseudogrignonensis]|nr:helix-turn-helix domain-containing protein [Brucella pseudogrignonensis]
MSEAQRLLCQGTANMDVVALASGFGSAHTLRHHFRKRLGISPGEYRTRFITE